MKIQRVIISIIALILMARVAIAYDFYGASITDREVPTAAWKAGIIGVRPIINDLTYDSPAGKAGFAKGDIILSINDKDVKKMSDLQKFTDNNLKVCLLRGSAWKTLVIDRLAIATEKSRRITEENQASTGTTSQSPYVDNSPNNAPPLRFDDATLERKYGTTTPEELAKQREIADALARSYESDQKSIKLEEKQREEKQRQAAVDNSKKPSTNKANEKPAIEIQPLPEAVKRQLEYEEAIQARKDRLNFRYNNGIIDSRGNYIH